jgi:predicted TIM-barrel fold metal-dependent hydrolase
VAGSLRVELACRAAYRDPALVEFMNLSRGLGRVLFGSDLPLLPMGKAMAAARVLPLTDTAANASLDGTAAHLLHLN